MQPRFWILVLMICLPAASRLGIRAMYDSWHFAPMAAMALFAGAYLRPRWLAFAIPLASMLLSDIGLGIMKNDSSYYTFHSLLPVIYACYALSVLLGMGIRWFWDSSIARQRRELSFGQRTLPVATGALSSSILFFLITNLGCWVTMYPLTLGGLQECYAMAIPFFRNTLISDMVFTGILFGGWAMLCSWMPSLEETTQLSPESPRV